MNRTTTRSNTTTSIRDRNATKLVVDASKIKAHDEENRQWLQEEWIPRMVDAGVEYSATVHADSVLSEREMESMTEDMAGPDVGSQLSTNDMSEALEWIAEAT